MSVNKATLIGRVGKDPEVKQITGGAVAKFTIATSESYKNKAGEKVEQTEWHNCVVFGKLCDVIEKYVKKGDLLYVEGKIIHGSYEDKDGNKRYTTDIKVNEMKMLGGKKEKSEPAGNDFTDSAKVDENFGRTTAPDEEPPFE